MNNKTKEAWLFQFFSWISSLKTPKALPVPTPKPKERPAQIQSQTDSTKKVFKLRRNLNGEPTYTLSADFFKNVGNLADALETNQNFVVYQCGNGKDQVFFYVCKRDGKVYATSLREPDSLFEKTGFYSFYATGLMYTNGTLEFTTKPTGIWTIQE